jgi:hypothetical protein
MRRLASFLSVVLLLTLGCTAGRTGAESEPRSAELSPQDVEIEVRNDLTPRVSVTIRIVRGSGSPVTLGNVGPGRTRSLIFREQYFETTYVLIAETPNRTELRSRVFDLYASARVVWRLANNSLYFSER